MTCCWGLNGSGIQFSKISQEKGVDTGAVVEKGIPPAAQQSYGEMHG
jgi:hypothetical protein